MRFKKFLENKEKQFEHLPKSLSAKEIFGLVSLEDHDDLLGRFNFADGDDTKLLDWKYENTKKTGLLNNILKDGIKENEDDLVRMLQSHVKETTAPYKYPRVIEYIEALPKTDSGKTADDVVDAEYESVSTRTLNELNIERIYILVSNRSASASELLIAGLLPYMEVRIIGDQTVGKNEGSRTLYDSPQSDFTEKDDNLNPNHTYALQPIISKLANSLDFSDYSTGFLPDIEAKETDYLEFMRPLGADDELLLSIAIDEITKNPKQFAKEIYLSLIHI